MMDDKFLFLNSMGPYGEMSNAERESGAGTRSDVSDGMKTECGRVRYNHQGSGPDLIVKMEPEDELPSWEPPPLPPDRLLLSRAQPGASLGNSMYAAPLNRYGLDRALPGPLSSSSHPTHRETFLEKERLRNVKFSDRENNVLVMEISENFEKILGRLMMATPVAEKREIWRDIVVVVNSVSHHTRTVAQCKKRYADIKKKVKEKLAKQRAGRQANVFFWPYEKQMLSLLSSKLAFNLNGGESPTMSDEDDSAQTASEGPPVRLNVNNGGQKADNAPIYRSKEDAVEDTPTYRAQEDAAEDMPAYLSKDDAAEETEKSGPYSDADQDSQENGNLFEAQCDSQQSGLDPSQNGLDPHQDNAATVERSLRHLSACIKAQTATLRQTNVILRNLSTNMQNGFQQLINMIQIVAAASQPDPRLGAAAQSSAFMPGRGGSHIGRGRPGRGRPGRGRGRLQLSNSASGKRGRGRSRDV